MLKKLKEGSDVSNQKQFLFKRQYRVELLKDASRAVFTFLEQTFMSPGTLSLWKCERTIEREIALAKIQGNSNTGFAVFMIMGGRRLEIEINKI